MGLAVEKGDSGCLSATCVYIRKCMWVLGWRLVSAAALCTPDPDRAAFLLLGTFTALQMCAGSSVAAERQGSGIP